jgi:hypothetical protein
LLAEPIADYIEDLQAEMPNSYIHVIIGHLAMDSYWEQALHQNSSIILNLVLSRMDNVVFTTVPYQIHHEDDEHTMVAKIESKLEPDKTPTS